MSQNGQTHFKNLAAFVARFLKCVWPFWDIKHERVNFVLNVLIVVYTPRAYSIEVSS